MADGVGFFGRYPRFLATTETKASANRLNARHHAIIAANAAHFAGQRVVDLGSHDGRWCFAALQAGARHVIGIEARPHLVEKACDSFRHYGVPTGRYRFIEEKALPALRSLPADSVDVMLCLGFFYHTMEHMALLLEARRAGARHLIVDTVVAPDAAAIIRLGFEAVADPRMSVDYGGTGRAEALTGTPSRTALAALLDYAGYDAAFFDWHDGAIDDWSDIGDYRDGQRVTLCARRRAAPS